MDLTIAHRNAERPRSTAAAAVIAAAVRAGHTITITTGSDEVRYTFALDDGHVTVTTDPADPVDPVEPTGWAARLAAAASRLI